MKDTFEGIKQLSPYGPAKESHPFKVGDLIRLAPSAPVEGEPENYSSIYEVYHTRSRKWDDAHLVCIHEHPDEAIPGIWAEAEWFNIVLADEALTQVTQDLMQNLTENQTDLDDDVSKLVHDNFLKLVQDD